MLFRPTCQVDLVRQHQGLGIYLAVPDFPAADALALLPALLQKECDILPKAGVAIAFHHQWRGNIPNDAVDAAEAGHIQLYIRDQ